MSKQLAKPVKKQTERFGAPALKCEHIIPFYSAQKRLEQDMPVFFSPLGATVFYMVWSNMTYERMYKNPPKISQEDALEGRWAIHENDVKYEQEVVAYKAWRKQVEDRKKS